MVCKTKSGLEVTPLQVIESLDNDIQNLSRCIITDKNSPHCGKRVDQVVNCDGFKNYVDKLKKLVDRFQVNTSGEIAHAKGVAVRCKINKKDTAEAIKRKQMQEKTEQLVSRVKQIVERMQEIYNDSVETKVKVIP